MHRYEKGGASFKEFGPVIFASGGFGADFTQNSVSGTYRPDLLHLPTTNGEHCTGDPINFRARRSKNDRSRVGPDPDAKIKFCGVGGLVFHAHGIRFASELRRRDYVTGEMWKNKLPFRHALYKAASDKIAWH